jgi:hypothetical protein
MQRYKVLKDRFATEYMKEQNKMKQHSHKMGRSLTPKPQNPLD